MKLLPLACLLAITLNALAECPIEMKKETMNDCPWAEVSRKILETPSACRTLLKKMTPELLAGLKAESGSSALFELWGEAKNFDDNAKGVIVAPEIIDCLAKEIKLKNPRRPTDKFDIVHAGLQHTYSYLFSNLETPYGYKRARWVSGDVQAGLGLSKETLLPAKKSIRFLSNVTYLFMKLAYPQKSELQNKKTKLEKEIADLDAAKFEIKNLVENIADKNISLKTTFVKFKNKIENSKNMYLLIYSYEDKKTGRVKLISGFPVDQQTFEKSTDASQLGDGRVISLRYNAWINGISDTSDLLKGSRLLIP